MPLPYFPIADDVFRLAMGTAALDEDRLIEVDARYREELALKRAILAEDHRYYFQAAPEAALAQWEAVELLLPLMARHYPEHFALEADGERWAWRNRLLGEETRLRLFDDASLDRSPLDWVGRQVQEDLLLLAGDAARGVPLIGGQLCFASGWCLDDMLGRPFLAIHARVPFFEAQIGRASSLLMERLKAGRPVGRVNWTVHSYASLNAAPRFKPELLKTRAGITPENAGARCVLRTERQTLARLPRSKAVLFTIHTYQASVAEVAELPERALRLANALRSMPEETREYKGIASYADALIAYLDARSTR
jgi:dimethylamine monooxygenase subunit A